MKQSRKKIFLCDSTKIGKKYQHNLCRVCELDDIICEKELPHIDGLDKSIAKKHNKKITFNKVQN